MEHDERFVYFSNTVLQSQGNEVSGTYVVPWGDMAYPLMTNPAVTRKTIGRLPDQSVSEWRAGRRGNFHSSNGRSAYGSTAAIRLDTDPGFAQNHLIYEAGDDVKHYVLDHHPQDADFVAGVMSLSDIGPDEIDALLAKTDEYQTRREEEARRLSEDDDYDPHAGPASVSGPWISALDRVHVRWDTLHSGFWWCDQRYGFVLDAVTGEFVGCYEGELLEVRQSGVISPDVWAAPLGFSSDECADSLELWQENPVEWVHGLAVRHESAKERNP